jgi:hypothetical protein
MDPDPGGQKHVVPVDPDPQHWYVKVGAGDQVREFSMLGFVEIVGQIVCTIGYVGVGDQVRMFIDWY